MDDLLMTDITEIVANTRNFITIRIKACIIFE